MTPSPICSFCQTETPKEPIVDSCSLKHHMHLKCIFQQMQRGSGQCPSCLDKPFLDEHFVEFYRTIPTDIERGPINFMQIRRIMQAAMIFNCDRVKDLTEQGISLGIQNLWEGLLQDAVKAADLSATQALLQSHTYNEFDFLMVIKTQGTHTPANASDNLAILVSLINAGNLAWKHLHERLAQARARGETDIIDYLAPHVDKLLFKRSSSSTLV